MPQTLKDPPHRWTSYHHETASNGMCGSLAKRGLPLREHLPLKTQLLLPVASGSPAASPTGCLPIRPGAYEPGGTMDSSSASVSKKARYSEPSPSWRLANSGMTMTGKRPVKYQRNSPSMVRQSIGDHG